jgi:uncharacterized protein
MKWQKYTIWTGALILAFLSACNPTKQVSENQAVEIVNPEARLADALLWKIESDRWPKPSYIFGTIHLIDKEAFYYPEGLLTAFEEVDQVAFEIEMDDMTDMSKQLGIMQKAFMRDNTSLKDLLSTDDYRLVKTHFDNLGIPLFFLERMQPLFLSVFGYSDMKPGDLQSGELLSYEIELNELAKQQGKKTAGLESIDYQLSAIDSIPYKVQADMLVQTIREGESGKDQFDAMIEMYTEQRIDDMYQSLGEESGGDLDFERILLTNRNNNWIPAIDSLSAAQPTLYAVGAGHLGGPEGVIRLLRKAGFKLTPISDKKR